MARTHHYLLGGIALGAAIILLFVSSMETDCVCTEEGTCFCVGRSEALHNVTDEDLQEFPESARIQYVQFLEAWEAEYEMRNREWAALYTAFHAEDHSPLEEQEFDLQLARAKQEFIALFRAQHILFRERLGSSPS